MAVRARIVDEFGMTGTFHGRIDGTGTAERDGKDEEHLLLVDGGVQMWVPLDIIEALEIEF